MRIIVDVQLYLGALKTSPNNVRCCNKLCDLLRNSLSIRMQALEHDVDLVTQNNFVAFGNNVISEGNNGLNRIWQYSCYK